MAIITVSRQWYSLGDEIAKTVADNLGYDLIDKARIGEALATLGIPPGDLERFDEKRPSVWDALAIQKTRFLWLLKAVVYEFAEKDRTLILGRGAQFLLKDLPGTLRVRIVAPFEVRQDRLATQEGLDDRLAEKMLKKRDRDSAGYIRAFFNADWNDQAGYDLLINTKTIRVATATGMIEHAIDSAEFRSDPDMRAKQLATLALQQKAEAAIMEFQRETNIHVAVTNVSEGIVTLRGTTDSETVKADCVRIISTIDGVNGINNEITVVKTAYT